jgi:hypothetical protein
MSARSAAATRRKLPKTGCRRIWIVWVAHGWDVELWPSEPFMFKRSAREFARGVRADGDAAFVHEYHLQPRLGRDQLNIPAPCVTRAVRMRQIKAWKAARK